MMIFFRVLVGTILFQTISIVCLAEEIENRRYFLKRFDNSVGLSQNTVTCIHQDQLGFMWFGTKDGLNKYEGHSFTVFRHTIGDPYSLGDNYVTVLCERKDKCQLWIGTSKGIFIYDMLCERFVNFATEAQETQVIISNPVNDIKYDSQGILWIATQGQGLFSYDEENDILVNHTKSRLHADSQVRSLAIDSRGFLWFTIDKEGLFYSDNNLLTISSFEHTELSVFMQEGIVFDMIFNANNHLYMASEKNGVIEVNTVSKRLRKLLSPDIGDTKVFMRKIALSSDNELWVGTETGVFIVDLNTLQYFRIKYELGDQYSLSDNAVHSLYKDRDGNMWIGTYFGGVNYFSGQSALFEQYYPVPGKDGLSGERVREFCEDSNGNIWIGTEDGGLSYFFPETGKITPFLAGKLYYNIHALYNDEKNNTLWVGTFSEGLYKINLSTNHITHYKKEAINSILIDNTIHTLYKDSHGLFWIGTGEGLQIFDEDSHSFIRIKELSNNLIRDIKEDSQGNIYCATAVSGLFYYDRQQGTWTNYLYETDNINSLPHNNVLSVFIDSKKQIWVTTQGGGFAWFNEPEKSFIRFSSYDGLPNDVTYQILEDDKGLLWISTNEGLIHFNPDTKEFTNYTLADGLLSKQFNYKSALRANDGKFYWGTLNGFISFNPNDIRKEDKTSNVVLTDFLLFNRKVIIGEEDSPLDRSITFAENIILKHDQNYISLKFADLNYDHLKNDRFLYKLEGFDSEWFSTGESYAIHYPNLSPGKYNFRLKSSQENDGDLITLPIEILPPWWRSGYAYSCYIVLALFLIYYLYRFVSKQHNLKQERKLVVLEQEKEREIYTAKIDFFTDIAHEIRTPLTLIKSPLENILKNKNVEEDVKEDLSIIDKNANRLHALTNQLLDFRKIEKQHFSLTFREQDIVELLFGIFERFEHLIKINNLNVDMQLPSGKFYAYVDEESIIKIVSNLLTNAIKNADTYIHILFQEKSIKGSDYFDLVIVNDGLVIPVEQREKIFKPFIQYKTEEAVKKTGTGLGLALARSLADLHQGFLSMDDRMDANSFRLTIPVLQKNRVEMDAENVPETVQIGVSVKEEYATKKTILVVEDDKELLEYTSKLLTSAYHVLSAKSGEEALKILESQMVNLVLSDIMMSNMDGYELCKQIKTNIASSHIPIVFLTAKKTLSSKIEGLDLGVDAYIEKPFSNEFLLATISNLLANREKIIETLTRAQYTQTTTTILSKADEEFMKTMHEIIEENLGNTEFNQDDFAIALHMSKSSLYRKIKGLLDISPNDFIRLYRVKKAAMLFENGDNRVTEVCYMVGFSTPSYFSKCFQKQFGVTPKEYIDLQRGTNNLNAK